MHDYGDMFAPTSTSSSSASSDDFSGHPPSTTNTTSFPEFFPAKAIPFLNTSTATTTTGNPLLVEVIAAAAALSSENSGYSSDVPMGSDPGFMQNYYYSQPPSLIQRCMSTQSLPNPIFSSLHHQSRSQNLELDSLHMLMRKVFSTGDIQTINMVQHQNGHRSDSPLSYENCNSEGTNKVRCYSPEERKERIERYRSKRSQRNFNKKIKYACRKTLADSRPRIRGRFARNEEIGESFQTPWPQMAGEEDEEDDFAWTNFLNALSTNLIPLDP